MKNSIRKTILGMIKAGTPNREVREYLLKDTIAYYQEDPNRLCLYKGECSYNPKRVGKEGISDGCAIGRLLTNKEKVKFDENIGVISNYFKDNQLGWISNSTVNIINYLDWYFMIDLQRLHDGRRIIDITYEEALRSVRLDDSKKLFKRL